MAAVASSVEHFITLKDVLHNLNIMHDLVFVF